MTGEDWPYPAICEKDGCDSPSNTKARLPGYLMIGEPVVYNPMLSMCEKHFDEFLVEHGFITEGDLEEWKAKHQNSVFKELKKVTFNS